jgi:hypothetical protein
MLCVRTLLTAEEKSATVSTPTNASYRHRDASFWTNAIGAGVLALMGLAALVFAHPRGLALFGVLALLLAAWAAYWTMWRLANRLELDGEVLRWSTPLRRGAVPVSELRWVTTSAWAPWRGSKRLVRFETVWGPAILAMETTELVTFAHELGRAAPDVRVDL